MKAVRLYTYGPSNLFILEDVPQPEPGEGEVLVRNYATTVNPFDHHQCSPGRQ